MAVTFTNKAANEMKGRVIKYLKSFSGDESLKNAELLLFIQLKDTLKISDDTLKTRAALTLQSILHQYSDFNISTIDKFILKIIRSFSFDLQIPFNFDVELDSDSIITIAVENVISEAGKNPDLTNFLLQYVSQLADEDGNWNIQYALTNVAKNTLNDNSEFYTAPLKKISFQDFLSIKKKIDSEIKEFKSKLDELLKTGEDLIKGQFLEAKDFQGKTTGSVFVYFCKPSADFYTKEITKTTLKYFENEVWHHKECSSFAPGAIAGIQNELNGLFVNIEDLKSKQLKKTISLEQVSKYIFQLALINEIEKQIQELKKENNFIHIAEFNKKVSEIVIQQPIPFIYERIGEKFKNYLIDEFQDTSELQWQNLMPLVENSLANGNNNLLVGDVKQAIYRWRGGNVDQFQNINNPVYLSGIPLVDERLQNIRKYIFEDNLSTNYRSLPNIVNFNNKFFESLLPKLSNDFSTTYYSDYKQDVGTTKLGGYVQISQHEKSSKDNIPEDYLNFIFSIISSGLQNNRLYKDFAILARDNKSLAKIGEFLTLNKVPILSSLSLSLSQSKEVVFVMAVYRLINQNTHIPSMIKVIEFVCPAEKISDVQFDLLNPKIKAYKNLELYLKNEHQISLPNIHNLSVYDTMEEIIRLFDLSKNDPFIQKFLDVVNAQQQNNNLDFIKWWEEKHEKIYISSPENINAVNLQTIHKAKGLEFPVVIYPFANSGKNSKSDLIWVNTQNLEIDLPFSLISTNKKLENSLNDKEYLDEIKKGLLDDLNTVYVALTRAAEELYILIDEPPKTENKGELSSLSKFFYPVLEHLKTDGNIFSMGEKLICEKRENSIETPVFKEKTVNSNWKTKIKLSYSAPQIWDIPLDSEAIFEQNDPRKFGNLIHLVFSKLSPGKNILDTTNLMTLEGLIEKGQKNEIESTVNAVLNLPLIKQIWNSQEQLIEQEFICANGSVLRPDRIIFHEDKTYLIDFKTGEESPKDKKQMQLYGNLLSEMGHQNIEPVLVYTANAKILTNFL